MRGLSLACGISAVEYFFNAAQSVIHLVVSVYVNLDSLGFALGVQIPSYIDIEVYSLHVMHRGSFRAAPVVAVSASLAGTMV